MKLNNKLLNSLLILIVLAGCTNKPTSTEPIETPIPIISAPSITPVNMKPVEFIVVTDNTLDKLKEKKVWYAISVDSYENLATNLQDMLRYIKDQQAQIEYYKANVQ